MLIGVLTNPQSRKNRHHAARIDSLRSLLGQDGIVRETADTDAIPDVVEEFQSLGLRYWVSDGGDGTFHWLLNSAREALNGGPLAPLLVPTNGGTIDFVAKKAGIRGRPDVVLGRLLKAVRADRAPVSSTLGTLEVRGRRQGETEWSFRRIGFAAAMGGVGQKFFSAYYDQPTQGGAGALKLILSAAAGIVGSLPGIRRLPLVPHRFREMGRRLTKGTRAHVVADGREFDVDLLQGLHAGAIDVDLGAVRLFPFAQRPGRLHLVVGAMSPLEATWKWAFLAAGRPAPGANWHEFAGQTMHIQARDGEVLDPVIDGELFHGFDALEVRVGPTIQIPRVR